MRSTLLFFVLLAAFLSPMALVADGERCAASAQAVPFCTLVADSTVYDSKEVIVSGLYRMVVHGSILKGPTCTARANVTESEDYKADKTAEAYMRAATKKNQFEVVAVVLRGTFRAAHQRQCFGQNCEAYEFEIRELLCAEKPTSESSTPRTTSHESGHVQEQKIDK